MKKIVIVLAIALSLIATSCFAGPTLQWGVASGEPDGFVLYWRVYETGLVVDPYTVVGFGPGTVREYDLSQLNLTPGERYEFFLTATKDGSESAPSDLLRYTYPEEQQIIEIPESNRPVSITINVR